MAASIRDFINHTPSTTTTSVANPTPDVRPAAFLTGLVDEFGELARDRGVALRLAMSSALPALRVEEQRLARALAAIVGCAIHSAARGGVVTVTAAKRDANVVFTIRESGSTDAPATYRVAVPSASNDRQPANVPTIATGSPLDIAGDTTT